jgi:hypothetical protein
LNFSAILKDFGRRKAKKPPKSAGKVGGVRKTRIKRGKSDIDSSSRPAPRDEFAYGGYHLYPQRI